ncbi:lasso peptide biosynthesis B2 protein [Sphingomonas koreensis]|nr:lasso peptide biosynthesis B2 protein [Sphingomonas koreensis]
MSNYFLARGVGFCRFDDCTLVLDIRRDRYWQLDVEAGILLASLHGSCTNDIPDVQLKPLIDLGLVGIDGSREEMASLPVPRRSLHDEIGDRTGAAWNDVLEIAWLTAAARARLRLRPLERTLARLRPPKGLNDDTGATLVELEARFERARSLVPLSRCCLPDTLAWLNFIRRRGFSAHLVFGVVAAPFQAHCWAQVGDIVHNDALDHARRFSPIFVV